MSNTITLSIIIISYNTKNILEKCLVKLEEVKKCIASEVIVIDNDSHDGSLEMVAESFPDVKLIHNHKNRGFATANNQGIDIATGRFILLLNSDAFLSVKAINELLHFMETNSDTGICGPQLLYENGNWQRCFGFSLRARIAFLDAIGYTSLLHLYYRIRWKLLKDTLNPINVDFVDGACMLIRKKLIQEIGPLDEDYFFYCEDAEFCLRARKTGSKVTYVPSSQVVHLRGGTSSKEGIYKVACFKYCSLQKFLIDQYGKAEWLRYLFWMRANFRNRYLLARLGRYLGFVSDENVTKYKIILQVFEGENND